ncbi:MAG: hypothetical protein NVSMB18_12920 [Acetobacteraceae bacterium]
MVVVGVSRLLNEADIVEPFIRHHATLLDLHIVLDNGSVDGTVEILHALHAEGLPIQAYQSVSPVFVEEIHNTGLYRLAVQAGADWVVPLDADELLVTLGAARPADILALAPRDIACLRMPLYRYAAAASAAPVERNPFERLTRRDPRPHSFKIAIRRLDPLRVTMLPGSHGAFIGGTEDRGLSQERLALAHFPDRSPLQSARKAILGRLKTLATGAEVARDYNTHIDTAFQALKHDPRAWLARTDEDGSQDLIEDPAPYRGGPLRYTREPDEMARLLSLIATQMETLALSHGRIMDRKRLIRRGLFEDAAVARRLF